MGSDGVPDVYVFKFISYKVISLNNIVLKLAQWAYPEMFFWEVYSSFG